MGEEKRRYSSSLFIHNKSIISVVVVGLLYKSCVPIKIMTTLSSVLHVDPGSESERRGRGPWGTALREEALLAKEGSICKDGAVIASLARLRFLDL